MPPREDSALTARDAARPKLDQQPLAPAAHPRTTLASASSVTADRVRLLQVAGHQLSRTPLDRLTLTDVAQASGLATGQLQQHFASLRDLGAAVLDHERSAMSAIQACVDRSESGPLEQIVLAFRLVGEELQRDVVMRAGVRLALESRHVFPERRLEPRRTWEGFLATRLHRARQLGLVRTDVDVEAELKAALTRALTVRDQIVANQTWSSAAAQLEQAGLECFDRLRAAPRRAASQKGGHR